MNATSLRLSRLLSRAPRQVFGFLSRLALKTSPIPAGIRVSEAFITSRDQTRLRLRIYRAEEAAPNAPALLWMHGGGYVIGMPEQDDAYLVPFILEAGAVVVSVDYRLAPEHPFPAPLEDCYSALHWLSTLQGIPGIDPQRIAVGGSSAGAGLAAALAQLAHDHGGIQPVFQLLVYPMLDDRTAARDDIDPQAAPIWSNASNRFGWEAYLHQPCGAQTVPAGSVPSRRLDLAGLPPAWIGVGTRDLFHDEAVDYARRLQDAGVPCELVTVPGAYHAFDLFDPGAQAVKEFRDSQVRALKIAFNIQEPSY